MAGTCRSFPSRRELRQQGRRNPDHPFSPAALDDLACADAQDLAGVLDLQLDEAAPLVESAQHHLRRLNLAEPDGFRSMVEGLCSIVIATRNEGAMLHQTVASVLDDTVHFAPWRIKRAIQAIGPYPSLGRTLEELAGSDVLELRAELETVRVRDDAWFVAVFVPQLEAMFAVPTKGSRVQPVYGKSR